MRIIQSFWTGNKNPIFHNYGWLEPKYNWLGWILSVNQLSKFYHLELYTDSAGFDFMIKKLKLPYDDVHVVFDDLNHYDSNLWAVPKIKAYALQKEPFLHVDGDVFIWEKFSKELMSQPLIAQNLEITTEYYKSMWANVSKYLDYIPREMQPYVSGAINFACNMGIFGGNDIDFFKSYTRESFKFINENSRLRNNIDNSNFNIFFEQVLFYLMTLDQNKKVSFLFNEISRDNEYIGMGDFNKVPKPTSYLHLLGHYKRSVLVCKQLQSYVLKFYPEFFDRLLSIDQSFYPELKSGINKEELESHDLLMDREEELNTNQLLARDILSIGIPQKFKLHLANFDYPYLKKQSGWSMSLTNGINGQAVKNAVIYEFTGKSTSIPIDDIDEMLFLLLESPIRYDLLLEEMLKQLDEDAIKIREKFIEMIEDRMVYFLTHRLVYMIE